MAIRNAREIIDPQAVLTRIGKASSLVALRERMSAVMREAYAHGKEVIKRRFTAEPRAGNAIEETSYLIDSVLVILHDAALPHYQGKECVAVVAVGGYGRSELFPYSDIDLLFLHEAKNKKAGPYAEWLLYSLWDLGLQVGHSVRTIDETLEHANDDATIRTNLLDTRFVVGDRKLYDKFSRIFEEFISSGSALDFVETKLGERNARHQRTGDSRYVLEPNIKEGKGGLRDLHTLWWLARYIYHITSLADLVNLHLLLPEEYKDFIKARDFLWLVRMHMHLIAGRPEEHLTFDMQRAVAEALGFFDDGNARAVERFMKQYFLVARTVGNLTRSVCAVLEEDKKRKPRVKLADRMNEDAVLGDFRLDGERLAVMSDDAFRQNPVQLITLFQVAHEQSLDIHPRTLQLVTRNQSLINGSLRHNEEANNAFMAILLGKNNPEPTLRRMSEAGVLGRFVPDFGRVTGQMQFDMYHVYTVDEHTIFAIGILYGIMHGKYQESMPVASDIIRLIKSQRVLFLSLFAHDIAKGRGGDHSMLGEVVVRKLARRFRFDAHEEETCAWLVRNHLLMSRTAFKRDLSDPKTIEDFIAKVQSPERLRLLLVLTVADIRAVGPHVWNGWKGALLRELYYACEEKMGASEGKGQLTEEANLRKELKQELTGWRQKAIDDYLDLGGPSFWQSCDAETHARIARLLKKAETSRHKLVLDTKSDSFRAITDMILCTPDSHGLFSNISGAIALAGANILSAKIFTLKNGMAVEMFHIQDIDNHAFDKPDKLARLAVYMNKAVAGELDISKEIAAQHLPFPSRMEVFKVPAKVFIENKLSANHSVIEVGGRDRIGFLHMITKVLADLHLTISTAHISTYGERAVDVFYVKDMFGMKIHHESKINQIYDALMAALKTGLNDRKKQAG
jgi:[protein-PII] uridylyltransferase